MKTVNILSILFFSFTSVLGQSYSSIYQKAFDEFVLRDWNSSIFKHECSRLGFEENTLIEININEPLADVDRYEISHNLDTSLIPILKGKLISNLDFERLYNYDSIFEGSSLNITKYKHFVSTFNAEPSIERKANYFLRMSRLFFWNDFVYISFWIKRSKYTSGTHIIYQFDDRMNLVNKHVYNLCDENH